MESEGQELASLSRDGIRSAVLTDHRARSHEKIWGRAFQREEQQKQRPEGG